MRFRKLLEWNNALLEVILKVELVDLMAVRMRDEGEWILKETNGFSPPTTLYFDEHDRHGKNIIGFAWEMDFESFLDPTLALENKDTPKGLT
ncbi:hypothetical protein Tco_1280595 [Tanacetum coccineum]